ncbi:hypothetical protein [Streptomyces sp. NPDC018000]
MEDGRRLPAAIEAAAYFVIAEALTNISKHSGEGPYGSTGPFLTSAQE